MTREDLLKSNADVVGDYAAKNAANLSPNAVIIVFANPMDVMCHAAARATGFPRERIIGQGGMLDSSRFRTFIAMELGWPLATSMPTSWADTRMPPWCPSSARRASAVCR